MLPTEAELAKHGLDADGRSTKPHSGNKYGFRELAIGERKPLGHLSLAEYKKLKTALERWHWRQKPEQPRIAILQLDSGYTLWRMR